MTIKEWCNYIVGWRMRKGFDTCWQNVPEKLMLIVTEVAETMEAYRKIDVPSLIKGVNQPALPNFKEEIADTVIRLFDLAGTLDIDLEDEINKKMRANEAREYKHGKNC